MFSGSYRLEDAILLLKPIIIKEISIEEKELLIQSGQFHYSQILSRENIPDENWHRDFFDSIKRNGPRMAGELLALAQMINNKKPEGSIALVSLARAGTPVGALLSRSLNQLFQRKTCHYSISIIRDRGIDENALRYILDRQEQEDIFFIDGWGAKGSIANELHQDISNYNRDYRMKISSQLYVLSDLCGKTDCSVSSDDYLIPGAMMNSTISGLVSRTILNELCNAPNDFHGCVFFSQFAAFDLSNWFLDEIFSMVKLMYDKIPKINTGRMLNRQNMNDFSRENRNEIYRERNAFLDTIFHEYNVKSMNEIKPGICESTRAMLRRHWHLLLVKDRNLPDLKHLIRLAETKNISVQERPNMPFLAISIAQKK